MNSVVLKFNKPETVSVVMEKLRNMQPKLTVASMSSTLGGEPFDKLLVAGKDSEIKSQLKQVLGNGWKSYIIQGEVVDGKKG